MTMLHCLIYYSVYLVFKDNNLFCFNSYCTYSFISIISVEDCYVLIFKFQFEPKRKNYVDIKTFLY